jgi:tungstate transport system permease protein
LETIRKIIELLFGVNPELRQIIGVTLRMSSFSTLVSSLIGIPLGVLIGSNEFKGKKLLNRFLSTLMGLPPVVAGLIVFLFLSRSGPLGTLKLLYSVTAMVIAQIVLISPIMTGLTANLISIKAPLIRETAAGISLTPFKRMLFTIYEVRVQLISTILVGFGRAIAEVGAVQMVGGNIQFKTRIMTTAIMMQTNMGNFEFAVALGIVLLVIAFLINSIVNRIQESTSK